jgi:hypothetical protein
LHDLGMESKMLCSGGEVFDIDTAGLLFGNNFKSFFFNFNAILEENGRRQAMAQLSVFPCLKGMGSLGIASYLVEMCPSSDNLGPWSTCHCFALPNIDREFADLGKHALFRVSRDNGHGPKTSALIRGRTRNSGSIKCRIMKQAVFCRNQLGAISIGQLHFLKPAGGQLGSAFGKPRLGGF